MSLSELITDGSEAILIDGRDWNLHFICRAGGFHVLLGRFSRENIRTSQIFGLSEKVMEVSNLGLQQLMAIFPGLNKRLSS